MRRPGPRPLASALHETLARAAPGTLLSRVQSCWSEAVGGAVAAEAEPMSERGGTVTVACRSAAWANELELLAPALLERLNEALPDQSRGSVTALRFRVS
jgi:predicted nucleic acid-binding Zn ribbon protein